MAKQSKASRSSFGANMRGSMSGKGGTFPRAYKGSTSIGRGRARSTSGRSPYSARLGRAGEG